MQGEPRFFPEERLADHINGDAETYYTYGVGDGGGALQRWRARQLSTWTSTTC